MNGGRIFQFPEEWATYPPIPDDFHQDSTALVTLNTLISPELRLERFEFFIFNLLEGCDIRIDTRSWPKPLDPLDNLGIIKLSPSRPQFIPQLPFSRWIDVYDEYKEGRVSLESAPGLEVAPVSDPRLIVDGFRNRPISYRWQLVLDDDSEHIRLDIRGVVGAARDLNVATGIWSTADCPTMCWLSMKTTLGLVSIAPDVPTVGMAQHFRFDPRIFVSSSKSADVDGLLTWLNSSTGMEPIDKTIFKMINCAPHEVIFNHASSTTPNIAWRIVGANIPAEDQTINASDVLQNPRTEAPLGITSVKYGPLTCSERNIFNEVKDPESRLLLNFSYSRPTANKINRRSTFYTPFPPLFSPFGFSYPRFPVFFPAFFSSQAP